MESDADDFNPEGGRLDLYLDFPRGARFSCPVDGCDQEVEATAEALTALIEPLMIAFLGGIIGAMIVALYIPIFKIFDLIK